MATRARIAVEPIREAALLIVDTDYNDLEISLGVGGISSSAVWKLRKAIKEGNTSYLSKTMLQVLTVCGFMKNKSKPRASDTLSELKILLDAAKVHEQRYNELEAKINDVIPKVNNLLRSILN